MNSDLKLTKMLSQPWAIKSLILFISFVAPLASSLYLPALPALGKHFHASDELMEFTVTIFLLGFGVSQLIYGPLSDAFGRRKILLLGIGITLVGSIGCAFANSGESLAFFRLVQGCGVGAGSALTRSMMRDNFDGIVLTKAISQVGAIFAIAPMLVPLVGGYVYHWFGWQATFIFIVMYVLLIWFLVRYVMCESNRYIDKTAIHLKQISINYVSLLRHPTFMGYLLCASFAYGGINAYVTMSPFLFQEKLGVSAVNYAWLTMIIASGLVCGRVINNILIRYLQTTHVIHLGVSLMLIAGATLLLPNLMGIVSVPTIVMPILLYIIGTGFIMPSAFSGSMAPFEKKAGTAGALYGSVSLLSACLISGITVLLREHSVVPLAVTYILLALGVLVSYRMLVSPSVQDTVAIVN